jgi:RpiR family carbohydrate utilization transcriptional regulator
MISIIRQMQASLSPAYARVAAVVLARPEAAVRSSITVIAQEAGVSEPTVLRFCRQLGCTSFPEFKLSVMRELAAPPGVPPPQSEVSGEDDIPAAADKVFQATIDTLARVRRALPAAALQRASTAIARARWVHVFGFGASATVAADAQHKLFRLGALSIAHGDAHMQAMAAATLGAEDVVLAISNTGRTRELLETVAVAAEGGATIVAITRPGSPLAAQAAVVLPVDVEERAEIYTPMTARIAQLAVIDALAVGVALLSPPSSVAARLNRIQRAINRRRLDVAAPAATSPASTQDTGET